MPKTLLPGVGLDVGTSFLIAARGIKDQAGQVNYDELRDAFFKIKPTSPVSAKMIEKGLANQKYFKDSDGSYIVIGQDAIERAVERHTSAARPMYRGVLSPREKDARRILKFILKELLGQPRSEGERLIYSIPAQPADQLDEEFDVGYHEDAIRNDLLELGYSPSSLNEAEAIGYSELENEEYTGICLSFGSGMVNVCVMSAGEAIIRFSLSRCGDWVDRMTAQSTGEADSVVQVEKENSSFIVGQEVPENPILSAVAMYYTRLIDYACQHLIAKLNKSRELPKFAHPIPVIISGGTSRAGGFVEYFSKQLLSMKSPVEFKEVRHAKDPLRAVARGLYIAASVLS